MPAPCRPSDSAECLSCKPLVDIQCCSTRAPSQLDIAEQQRPEQATLEDLTSDTLPYSNNIPMTALGPSMQARLSLMPLHTTKIPAGKGPGSYCMIAVPCLEYTPELVRDDSASVKSAASDRNAKYRNKYPNKWSRVRELIREPAAEFLGVMILVLFSNGANAQVFLSANNAVSLSPRGDWLSTNFSVAVGAALGVWISGAVSGGHINPAVTIALATFRDFPWRKVPAYILAQVLGGVCGAGIVYANYIHAIDIVEGGRHVRTLATAGLFAPYAADYMTNISCFFDEFIGAAILLISVLAFTDRHNGPPPPGLVPLAIFVLILGIGAAFGAQTGYAINPARDLGPRILTAMVGYGSQVFTYRNQYWLWCPLIGSVSGALVGTFVYDALIYTGPDSVLNRSNGKVRAADLGGGDAI